MKKKIGMIIAVEFTPFEQAYGKASQKINKQGYEVSLYEKENYVLYVLQSGAGEIQAAMSTQFLIDEFGVEMILNYGVVGALTEKLSHALVCIVKEVIDYRFDISEVDNVPVGRHIEFPERIFETDSFLRKKALEVEPNLLEVVDASGDRFVNKAEEKQAIAKDFGADICEMEASGILLTCIRNKIPALFIKVVADTLFGGAEEYSKKTDEAVRTCVHILDHIMENL